MTKALPKFVGSSLTTKRGLIGLAVIGLFAAAAGFAIDATSFGLHLLAELVAFAVTVVAAILVLDRFAERQSEQRRQTRWTGVRKATLVGIWDQLQRVFRPIQILSPDPNFFALDYEVVIGTWDKISEWTNTRAIRSDSTDQAEFDRHRSEMSELHDAVTEQYRYIRDVLAPRVLELADDITLVELLHEFDRAERRWSRAVDVAGQSAFQHWPDYAVWTWGQLHVFCESAVKVARHIARDLPPSGTLLLVWAADGKTSLEMEVDDSEPSS